jgi:hypothetical protein
VSKLASSDACPRPTTQGRTLRTFYQIYDPGILADQAFWALLDARRAGHPVRPAAPSSRTPEHPRQPAQGGRG